MITLPSGPAEKKTILVVDDTPENLTVLGQLLKPYYRVKVAPSGQRALRIAVTDPKPDLILLDVMMPEMDGYEVIRRLREDPATHDIPVIFVTAMDSVDDEEHGLHLGAVDYIIKPIKPAIVLARVAAHLELKEARDWLQDQNAFLEAEVERRMHDNQLIQDISIRTLASLAEARDTETGNHIRRTQSYVAVLARHLSSHHRFSGFLTPNMIKIVAKSAPLHDIGKVGIPDSILLKPGRLTPEEFEIMKTHSRIGGDAIEQAMREELSLDEFVELQSDGALANLAPAKGPMPLTFLSVARDIARWHHERWDGSGYPDGLSGDAIPIAARLMAIADVFDALVSRRIYKAPFSFDKAVQMIRDGSGSHFDPDVVAAFEANLDAFGQILKRFSDNEEALAEKLERLKTGISKVPPA